MESFGVTPASLSNSLQQINNLESAYILFLKEKGEAQDITVTRDKAFDKLYDWYSDFRAVSRVAMYDQPQLLEKMGIVVKN